MEIADAAASEAEFDAFYHRTYIPTLRVVFALCGSWSVAEELTQDAFVRALVRWSSVHRLEQPDAWVRRVALNLATSAFRRRAAEARALVRLRGRRDPPVAEPAADLADFVLAVRTLPRRQAQAVVLRYIDDLSVQQIAEVMGCAEGTVKAHLAAGRQRLIPLMGDTSHG